MIYNVGINDSDYVVNKFKQVNGKKLTVWVCPYYELWRSMLRRCYSEKFQEKQPAYKGCVVADDWHRFSNFRSWCILNHHEGYTLDKDILGNGKVYSSETCCFVPDYINIGFIKYKMSGKYMIGVKDSGQNRKPYEARITEGKKRITLGTFETELEAHQAWQRARIKQINCIIERYKSEKYCESAVMNKLVEMRDVISLDLTLCAETKRY